MAKFERVRDFISAAPSADYFREKTADGWRLAAIEWERGVDTSPPVDEVPFGLRVADGLQSWKNIPTRCRLLVLMMETIVHEDGPLSQAARVLNDRGFRTRDGQKWTPKALFYLLPRLIEVGPKLCTSEEWVERRKHIFQHRVQSTRLVNATGILGWKY